MELSQKARKAAADNEIVRFAFRARVLAGTPSALRERPRQSLRYLFRGRELTNFYYELENLDELAGFVSDLLAVDVEQVRAHIDELYADEALRRSLKARLQANPKRGDVPRYGYRVMHYCIVRLTRPAVVAELGIHDGLGAAVVLRALGRNADEGHPGTLLAFDAVPQAGWLIDESLGGNVERHYGDVNQTLEPALAEHGIDFLIQDIGHSFPRNEEIFRAALRHARGPLLLRSEVDAANTTLAALCASEGGTYATFRERPADHFWPGHLIGLGRFGDAEA